MIILKDYIHELLDLVYDENRCMLLVINKTDKYKRISEESVKKNL